MDNISIEYEITSSEFLEMITSVGWKSLSLDQIEKGIERSMYVVKVLYNDNLAGMGRIVGDFYTACLLCDICVKEEYRNKGLGTLIVKTLKELVEKDVEQGNRIIIELIPTHGLEGFYQKLGFKYKPEMMTGMYLWIDKTEGE